MVELDLHAVLSRVPVSATLDVLYLDEHGDAVLVDHKTGKAPYTADRGGGLQLGIYAALLLELFGLPVARAHYYLARTATLTDPIPVAQ